MPTITWNENSPADGDNAGQGDDAIRSLKTSIRVGLEGEHVWPSGGGDAGVHRLGSARAFVGAQSLVSSAGTDGRLMWTSDTSQLFHAGSGGTALVGGVRAMSAGSFPGAVPQRAQWVMEFGTAVTDVSGSTTITWPNSGFSGSPFVLAFPAFTGSSTSNVALILQATPTASSGQINSTKAETGAAKGAVTFHWLSIGTRTF